jgi:hypothetical protein
MSVDASLLDTDVSFLSELKNVSDYFVALPESRESDKGKKSRESLNKRSGSAFLNILPIFLVDSVRVAKGAEMSTASGVACDERTARWVSRGAPIHSSHAATFNCGRPAKYASSRVSRSSFYAQQSRFGERAAKKIHIHIQSLLACSGASCLRYSVILLGCRPNCLPALPESCLRAVWPGPLGP